MHFRKNLYFLFLLFGFTDQVWSSNCNLELKELFSIRFNLSTWQWSHQTGPYNPETLVGLNNGVIAGNRAHWARLPDFGLSKEAPKKLEGPSVDFHDAQLDDMGKVLKIRVRNTWDHFSADWHSIPYRLSHLAEGKIPKVEFDEEYLKNRNPELGPVKLEEGTLVVSPLTEEKKTSPFYFEGELRISQEPDQIRINHFALGPKADQQWGYAAETAEQELEPVQELLIVDSTSFVFMNHQSPYQAAARWQMLSIFSAIVGQLKKETDQPLAEKSPLEVAAEALGLFGNPEVKEEAQKIFKKIQKTSLQRGELKLKYFQKNSKSGEPSITTVTSIGKSIQKREYIFGSVDAETLEIRVNYETLVVESEMVDAPPVSKKSSDRVLVKISSDGKFFWRPETRPLIPTPQIGYSNKMGYPPPSEALSEIFSLLASSPTPLRPTGPHFATTLFTFLDEWVFSNAILEAIRSRGTSVIPTLDFMADQSNAHSGAPHI